MKKLKINYTANAAPKRDCSVEAHARFVVEDFLKGTVDVEVHTSSEIEVLAFRVLVHEQVIPAKHMEIQFNGEPLELTKDGKIAVWPEGFCDVGEKLLLRMF